MEGLANGKPLVITKLSLSIHEKCGNWVIIREVYTSTTAEEKGLDFDLGSVEDSKNTLA